MMSWFRYAVFFVLLVALTGCGGGGGATGPSAVTLTGAVTFPPAPAAKLVASMVTDPTTTITVYDLAGNAVAKDIHPEYNDALDPSARTYTYTVPNLKPGVDYVVKAAKGSQVVRKLVEKDKTSTANVTGMNVDVASTTALIITEQKLKTALNVTGDLKLGEVALSDLSAASAKISDLKPSTLETMVNNLSTAMANGNLNAISNDNVALANAILMVNAAVAQNVDPRDFMNGKATTAVTVATIELTNGVATQMPAAAVTSTDAAGTAASAGTSYNPGNSASFYVGLAQGALSARDIANANSYYEQALAADPNNKEANFGGAITKGIMLVADPQVDAIITKWGAVAPTVNQVVTAVSPVGNPFSNISSVTTSVGGGASSIAAKQTAKPAAFSAAKVALDAFSALKGKLPQQVAGKSSAKVAALAPSTAPSVSEMQAVVDSVILPALQTISARLAKVEGTGYSFTVTKAMQGNSYGQDVVLNDGEFNTIDAAANAVATLCKIATAYNLDVANNDYNAISQDPLATLNNSAFFTLKADGKAKMVAALDLLKTTRDKAEKAYTIFAAGQGGAIDISSWSASKKQSFSDFLTNAKAVLTGSTAITIHGKTVTVDATKFFTNPLTRSSAPTLGYDVPRNATLSAKYGKPVAAERSVPDWSYGGTVNKTVGVECSIVPTSDLPDYTLNGILPQNTIANNVAGFNGILPVVGGAVLSGDNSDWYQGVTTDGTSIWAAAYDYTSSSTSIKKINPATGVVTTVAGLNSNNMSPQGAFFGYGGHTYCFAANWQPSSYTLGIYQVDTGSNPWVITSAPVYTFPSTDYMYVNSVFSTGSDIYYVQHQWNPTTYTETATIHKLANLGSNPTDTTVFTVNGWVDSVMYSNGYFYTIEDSGMVKRSADGTLLASYAGGIGDNVVLIGGNFYSVDPYAGKIVKHAGTPSKGTAKSLASAVLGINF